MTEKDAMNKLMDLLKKHKFIVCIIIGIFILSTILNLFIPIINKDIMDNGFIGGNSSLFIRDIIALEKKTVYDPVCPYCDHHDHDKYNGKLSTY